MDAQAEKALEELEQKMSATTEVSQEQTVQVGQSGEDDIERQLSELEAKLGTTEQTQDKESQTEQNQE